MKQKYTSCKSVPTVNSADLYFPMNIKMEAKKGSYRVSSK